MKIPTNIITGQLGAGKTTVVLNLIEQIGFKEKVLWLKNEFGDLDIDAKVAKSKNIQAAELTNGCLCCVLIGKLDSAIHEILETYKFDRLIIETAGTAHPEPILNRIALVRELEIDSVIKVIDCKHFEFFNDKSPVARKQSNLFDLIVLNKFENVEMQQIYKIEDEIYDLYLEVPKFKAKKGFVPENLIIDLFSHSDFKFLKDKHNHNEEHEHEDFDSYNFKFENRLSKDKFEKFLKELNPKEFYRVKGIIRFGSEYKLLNFVHGDFDFKPIENYEGDSQITFIGKEIGDYEEQVREMFNLIN